MFFPGLNVLRLNLDIGLRRQEIYQFCLNSLIFILFLHQGLLSLSLYFFEENKCLKFGFLYKVLFLTVCLFQRILFNLRKDWTDLKGIWLRLWLFLDNFYTHIFSMHKK